MLAMGILAATLIIVAGKACAFVAPQPSVNSRVVFASLNDGDLGNEATLQRPKTRFQTIPVVGPIPGREPLLLGADVFLDPPTPLQWKALEESISIHHRFKKSVANVTAVDAGPMIAFIDYTTGSSQEAKGGRYATIATIAGMTTPKRAIETSDDSSFMESLAAPSRLSSRVRLVGVGRASLTEFFYKIPSSSLEDDDPSKSLGETPVVMAEFKLISDSSRASQASLADIGTKGARSVDSAPVFFVTKLSNLANSVTRLHDERRRLSQILVAAKARLEDLNMFEDSDGIGMVGNLIDTAEFNVLKPETPNSMNDVVRLENYGVNVFSSFASINALTDAALVTDVQDFYSPERRHMEEHRLEMLSFVAFRALSGYCTAADVGWALQSTNTAERLSRAHELMMEHVVVLKRLASQASEDLTECGEECTDLW